MGNKTQNWSIPVGQKAEDVTLKQGFKGKVQFGFIRTIEDYLDALPDYLQKNFPVALKDKLPKDWYIRGKVSTYSSIIYVHGENSVDEEIMETVRDIIPSGDIIPGTSYYVKNVDTDDIEEIKRIIIGSSFIKHEGDTIAIMPSSFKSQLSKWQMMISLQQFDFKVNIGKNNHPADAVWWIERVKLPSGWTTRDNIVCSIDGNWQVLPKDSERAINNLSLSGAIEMIEGQ